MISSGDIFDSAAMRRFLLGTVARTSFTRLLHGQPRCATIPEKRTATSGEGNMDSKDIRTGRLYDDLAYLWPLVSDPAEYAEEAGHWRAVLREKLGAGRHTVLELGVGGGHNLSHLTPDFEATAVDLSEAMLVQCRALNPEVPTHVGDMRTVRLGKKFAAVLIQDAVSHMLTEADVLAVFETAAVHLDKGGVVIACPDRYLETFWPPETEHVTHANDTLRVTWFEYTYDPDPADTVVETLLTYVIESEDGVRIEHDRLHTGIFLQETWLELMNQAGFTAELRTFPLQSWTKTYQLLVGVRR
jgi:hypothetical protein